MGWGGVVGEVRDKAISTQVVVEVEVGVELGKNRGRYMRSNTTLKGVKNDNTSQTKKKEGKDNYPKTKTD